MKQNVKNQALRIFLAICMVTQMMGGAFAAPENVSGSEGTITVNATAIFDVYEIFQIVELDDTDPGPDAFYNYKMITNPVFYAFFDDVDNADLDSTDLDDGTYLEKYTYASQAAKWLNSYNNSSADRVELGELLKDYVASESPKKTVQNLNGMNLYCPR